MKDQGHVLLVGSVARPEDGWDVEDVLRNCAGMLGDHVSMLPDGEVGDRSQWINYIARRVYHGHPDIITLSRHTFEDWKPRGLDDLWRLTIREGVDELRFDWVGYAAEAKRSYEIFRALRSEGVIQEGVRFLVALPLIESATRFMDTPRNFETLWRGYGEVIAREIHEMAEAIPHEDLAIQWDMARETAAVEGVEFNFPSTELTDLPADPMERYAEALSWLCPEIPEDVWLGLHVCYGSLGHQEGETPDSAHYVPIRDLNVSVDMANRGVEAAGRSVQYVHMPVQFANGFDVAFYEPLRRLNVGEARTYLGLVDARDGLEGALGRVEVAKRHLGEFGIATPCGWGRRPADESIEDLLELEKAAADAMSWPMKAVP